MIKKKKIQKATWVGVGCTTFPTSGDGDEAAESLLAVCVFVSVVVVVAPLQLQQRQINVIIQLQGDVSMEAPLTDEFLFI